MADDTATRPLSSGSLDAADGCEIPLPALSRLPGPRRRRRARCDERGGSAPLAACTFLVIVSIATAVWSSWMVVNNALAAKQLREEAAARCERLVPSDRRTHAAAFRQAGSGSTCVIGAAELLQQVAQMSVYHIVSGQTIAWPPMPALSSMSIYWAGKGVARFRPSVHLELPASAREQSRESEARSCNVTTDITTWTAGSSGHVRGDLSVEAGRISVKSTGYYYVYSQVSSEDRSCRSADGLTLRQLRRWHSILRDNPLLKVVADELLAVETLHCTRDSRCQQGGNGGSSFPTPSYLGATFHLLRGDKVYVRISCIDDVKTKPAETYFGVHMI